VEKSKKGLESSSEFRLIDNKGNTRWVIGKATPLFNKDHEITGYIGTLSDITENKKADEVIRQSEIKLKEAQAIAQVGNWEIDLEKNITAWSDELYKIYGLNKDEILPDTEFFLSAMHPDDLDFAKAKVQEAFDSLLASSFSYRFIKKDGTVRHGYTEWKFEFDKNGKPSRLFGIIQDITDRKRSEEELKQINDELHSLSSHLQNVREEERIQIARDIHDELGQQLTGLKMNMNWLNKKLATEDELIKEKINGMIELIDETVKSVRRISSNLRPSILDDLGLIAALEWHGQEVEKRAEIKVIFCADMTEPELTVAMSTGIFRIYQEVLTNVVRHANAHKVKSSLQLIDNCLVLKIKDDGQGMDQAMAGTKKTLGLIGIKERTFAMGGKYNLNSEPGKGTEIEISIPYTTKTLS
jgi:PAS domain S-box-containing protein